MRATSRLGRYTPLHVACQSGAVTVVTALVASGADVTAATGTGATALMLAAQSGHAGTVSALLDAKADVNALEAAHGQSALMFAAAADRADVVRLLVARGATVGLTSKVVDVAALTDDSDGRSIREIAAELGIKTHAASVLWFAAVDGGPEAHLCNACVGTGERGGVPCKPCQGTGVE